MPGPFSIRTSEAGASRAARPRRAAPAVLGLVVGLALAPSAAAQLEPSDEVGKFLARTIAAGVVLSSNDFAAGGSYDVDDAADSTFGVSHLGYRQRFRDGRPGARPFAELSVGKVVVEQKLDLGGPVRDDSSFETRSARLIGGARFPIAGPWFVQAAGGVEYSRAESELDYRSDESAALAPVLDGVLFNWSADALTLLGVALLGYRHETAGGTAIDGGLAALWMRTDPTNTDHPLQDVTSTSSYERVYVRLDVPLGLSPWQRPLYVAPGIEHTFLSGTLSDPLDSDGFTEVGVAISAAMRSPQHRFPVERIGLSVGYTRADAFSGWSVGLVLARWSP